MHQNAKVAKGPGGAHVPARRIAVFITLQRYFTVSPKVSPEPEKTNRIISTFNTRHLPKSFAPSCLSVLRLLTLCCGRWCLLLPPCLPHPQH